jgi:periplasmic divalent cation tolerance protein
VTALLCLCACPDEATAGRIADALVGERLAACVQVLPGMTSVYRWEGRVERAREVLLLAKTTRARFEALQARIVALHPHAVPEVVATGIDAGLPAYLAWIAAGTAQEPAA